MTASPSQLLLRTNIRKGFSRLLSGTKTPRLYFARGNLAAAFSSGLCPKTNLPVRAGLVSPQYRYRAPSTSQSIRRCLRSAVPQLRASAQNRRYERRSQLMPRAFVAPAAPARGCCRSQPAKERCPQAAVSGMLIHQNPDATAIAEQFNRFCRTLRHAQKPPAQIGCALLMHDDRCADCGDTLIDRGGAVTAQKMWEQSSAKLPGTDVA